MAKSKIFIASSGRTLVLAEQLRDQLQTDYCDAWLWKEVSEGRQSDTIIEMLEEAAKDYDFAVILLARDDVMVTVQGDKLKARDNCVFEAGLFMAAIGRRRCFLVNSVKQSELPSDLGGILSLPFTEPKDLDDRNECRDVIRSASTWIKNAVQKTGARMNRPLSRESLLAKERKTYEGGELFEGQVVVASIQPLELAYEAALQVRKNIDGNIRYVYFFPGNQDGAEKILQLLQLVLLDGLLGSKEEAAQYPIRREKVKDNQEAIVEALKNICLDESIKIYFLPASPDLQYCIHNATDIMNAKLYVKHRDEFIEWESGSEAYQFWNEVRAKQGLAEPQPPHAVFYGAPGFNLTAGSFLRTLEREAEKYFPGIAKKVLSLCLQGPEE